MKNRIEPFKLERYFALHEFTARKLASSSDAESMTLGELLELAPHTLESLLKTKLSYSDSLGLPELRVEIAKTYKGISERQVLVHTGAQEPIHNFFHALFGEGDHVIVQTPAYQSLYSIPKSLGCEVTLWETTFETNWKLDLSELEKLIRPNTKAVVINVPHNPTGSLLTKEEQSKLVALLSPSKIILFSDEVYRGLELEPKAKLPAACEIYENAVSLGVLSKAHGLPGLRLGWVATRNEYVIKQMAEHKDYTTICGSILTETLAVIGVKNQDKLISKNREIVISNWNHAAKFFSKNAAHFECVAPLGGTMVFPRAKPGMNLPAFISHLIKKRGIMLIGGENFDMPENYFRLGLGRKDFAEVLDEIEAELKTE